MFAVKKCQADVLLSFRHKLQQSVERTVMEEKNLLKRNYLLKYYLRYLGNDEIFFISFNVFSRNKHLLNQQTES